MKMRFSHSGRQFFFITLTLEGRLKVLSHLVSADREPELTERGKIVLAFLKALHSVWPSVTVSNRVIMPDHIHFLMVVNYDLAPEFNPLWVSFMVMDAIEEAWARTDRTVGWLAPPEPPDKVLEETVRRGRYIAGAITSLMKERGLSREDALTELLREGLGGRQSPVRSAIRFDRRVNIELSFNSSQLKTIRRYIRLNPARALWKAEHPDRFVRFSNIAHPVLDKGRIWDAMGNITLLGSPFLFHVRLTLKKTVAEHEAEICEIVEKAKRGMVPVSGFISPGEVEALRRLKATQGARFVKLLPCAMPPRYDPSAEDSRELADDRLLILSGFRNTNHISALEMRRDPAEAHLFRANCLAMNDIATDLCTRAQTFC